MRWWAVPFAVLGLVHGAGAGEFNSEIVRGPIARTYRVIQTPAQELYLRGSERYEPTYEATQTLAHEGRAAPYHSDIASPTASWTGYKAPPPPPFAWDWTGFYAGTHSGFVHGSAKVDDPYGPSIYGDKIILPGYLFGLQAGFNKQVGNFIFGVELDGSWADVRGTNTCFAFSGLYVSANCRVQNDWIAMLTARFGVALGPQGRTLLYAKGGGAATHTHGDLTDNNLFGIVPAVLGVTSPQTSYSQTLWGYTVGIGIEHAMTPAWSWKLEYNYMNFADFNVTSPTSIIVNPATGAFVVGPALQTSVHEQFHVVKLGVNYHFGQPWNATFPDAPMWSGWQFEGGLRYWYSSGRFQKDLPAGPGSSVSLVSRLTYDGLTSHAGEIFGRVDTPVSVFLKGNAGLGRLVDGHMNDEDWGLITAAFTSYSNTTSNLTNTNLNYATFDVGINLLRGITYKVGPFVGYNYWHEQMAANTCTQIALPASGICSPAINGVPVITETDTWQSLRIGSSAEVTLAPGLRLSGEAAYLPYVKFTGVDNHWLRALVIDESGTGHGVQVEGLISYEVTPHFTIGAGGRYWVVWTTTGSDAFNGVPINRDDTYRAERYGAFLQAAYRY